MLHLEERERRVRREGSRDWKSTDSEGVRVMTV